MNFTMPEKKWWASLSLLTFFIVATTLFNYGQDMGLSAKTSDSFAMTEFYLLLVSGPISFLLARICGAKGFDAVRIGLLVPCVWYLREIYVATGFFSLPKAIFWGFQGSFLAYFSLTMLLFGVIDFFARLTEKFVLKQNVKVLPAILPCLPFIILFAIENYFWINHGYDVFVIMGFLEVYSAIFL